MCRDDMYDVFGYVLLLAFDNYTTTSTTPLSYTLPLSLIVRLYIIIMLYIHLGHIWVIFTVFLSTIRRKCTKCLTLHHIICKVILWNVIYIYNETVYSCEFCLCFTEEGVK